MSDSATQTIEIQVLRFRPEQDQEPVWQSFVVPYTDDMSVLQGLQQIKDDQDGSLSFRWSCRMAICGSCGMMINGEAHGPEYLVTTCQTYLRNFRDGQTITFQVTGDTKFRSKGGQVKSLEDLQEGMIAMVGAEELSNGKYQAQVVAAGKLPNR